MKEINSNRCDKCMHFIQHYAFTHNYHMLTVCCGHCKLGNKKCAPHFCCEDYKKGRGEFFRKKEIDAIEIISRATASLAYLKKAINKSNLQKNKE